MQAIAAHLCRSNGLADQLLPPSQRTIVNFTFGLSIFFFLIENNVSHTTRDPRMQRSRPQDP